MMNPAEFANIAASEEQFWWYRGMRGILFAMLDPVLAGRRIERVLDAGCGTGYMARAFHERYGWRVWSADVAGEGLHYARGLGLGRVAQADLQALPFAAGSFQIVTSLDTLAYFQPGAEETALRELLRVLSPGGLLVVRVAALELLRSRHSQFTGEIQRFTRRGLAQSARRTGMRILRLTYANSLLLPVALVRFRIWEPLFRKAPASGVQPAADWLDRLLYLPLALEAHWLACGANFPLGQSLVLIGEKREDS